MAILEPGKDRLVLPHPVPVSRTPSMSQKAVLSPFNPPWHEGSQLSLPPGERQQAGREKMTKGQLEGKGVPRKLGRGAVGGAGGQG